MEYNLLPVVDPKVCFSVEKMCEQDNDRFILEYLSDIKKKNPIVALWITRFAKTTNDKLGAVACAAIAYKLLESQSEANMLAEMYKT
jgi:hypothetical protein